MASKYPKALDDLPEDSASSTNAREGKPTGGPEGFHSGLHNDTSAALNAVQEALGTEPQGDEDTVADRLDEVDAAIALGLGELPANVALLEAGKLKASQVPLSVVSDSDVVSGPGTDGKPILSGIADVPEVYGAKGDGIAIYDAAIEAASKVLSSATHAFTVFDVGKLIVVWGAAANVNDALGTSQPGTLFTTIASAAGGKATLTAAATTTVAAATCKFGTDDTAALNACYAANKAATAEGGAGTSGTNGYVAVRHRAARYCYSGEILFGGQADLAGAGIRNTHFEAMAPAATMRFAGRGTWTGGFNIHGNYIARRVWSWDKGDGTESVAQRHFDSIEAKFAGPGEGAYSRTASWSELLYSGAAQNVTWTNIELGYSYGDGWVNDYGGATNRAFGLEIERWCGHSIKFIRTTNTGNANDNSVTGYVIERPGIAADGKARGGVYIGSGSLHLSKGSGAMSGGAELGGIEDASYPNPNPNKAKHFMANLVEKLATAGQAKLTFDDATANGSSVANADTFVAVGDQGIVEFGNDVFVSGYQAVCYPANTAVVRGLDRVTVNGCGQTWTNGTGTTVNGSKEVTAVTKSFGRGDGISGAGIPAGAFVTKVAGASGNWTLTISAAATASAAGVAVSRVMGFNVTGNSPRGLYVANVAINAPALPAPLALVHSMQGVIDLGEIYGLTNTQIDALITAALAANGGSQYANQFSGIATCTYGSRPAVIVRRQGVWTAVTQQAVSSDMLSGAIAETMNRSVAVASFQTVSGTMTIARLGQKIPAGQIVSGVKVIVSNIGFVIGTGTTGNAFAVLMDENKKVVSRSTALTATTTNDNEMLFNFATGDGAYTPTQEEVMYVGLVYVVGTGGSPTVPTLQSSAGRAGLYKTAPALAAVGPAALTERLGVALNEVIPTFSLTATNRVYAALTP